MLQVNNIMITASQDYVIKELASVANPCVSKKRSSIFFLLQKYVKQHFVDTCSASPGA